MKSLTRKISMLQDESKWDKLLMIKSSGRDASRADSYRYPYEPTPYSVLERLANSGYINKNSILLDYGCGKGRVDFYLSYQTRCKAIGIEYDERIFKAAMSNLDVAVSKSRVSFVNENAEGYKVPEEVNVCYFFNPFSIELLMRVVTKIIDSYYANPREIMLMIYYPSDEYIGYLMSLDEIMFIDEIDCRDLFDGENKRERIMIFST